MMITMYTPPVDLSKEPLNTIIGKVSEDAHNGNLSFTVDNTDIKGRFTNSFSIVYDKNEKKLEYYDEHNYTTYDIKPAGALSSVSILSLYNNRPVYNKTHIKSNTSTMLINIDEDINEYKDLIRNINWADKSKLMTKDWGDIETVDFPSLGGEYQYGVVKFNKKTAQIEEYTVVTDKNRVIHLKPCR